MIKLGYISAFKIVLLGLIISIIFSQCKKEENPPGPPVFNSLEEEVDYLVQPYLKVGFLVGIIDNNQNKIVLSYGSKTTDSEELPDENTVFEIGSINKSFTCLLTAINWRNGVFENDTVQYYLPMTEVTLPMEDSTDITLYHLATHTAGIPRSPVGDGAQPPSGYHNLNPYAAYTTDYIYDYLTNDCELLFGPGSSWEYSNTGMGLLGHIIGLVDSSSYEGVLKREVFDVLGMTNSSLFLTTQQKENVATGYNKNLTELPEFTAQDIMQGAGFIKSSAADMLKYLKAQMGLTQTPLLQAMEDCHQPQFEVDYFGEQCFGWYKQQLDDGQLITWCGGNTIGFGSYLGFNESSSTGVILWYNADFDDGANLKLGPAILEAIQKY